ncbi:MAG: hypothetical protein WCP91_02315, partial [Candidatus Berkelbacteria bacterium]
SNGIAGLSGPLDPKGIHQPLYYKPHGASFWRIRLCTAHAAPEWFRKVNKILVQNNNCAPATCAAIAIDNAPHAAA